MVEILVKVQLKEFLDDSADHSSSIAVRLLKERITLHMRKAYILLITLLVVLVTVSILNSLPKNNTPVTYAQSGSIISHGPLVQKPILFAIQVRWRNATPAFTLTDVKQALQTHSFRGGPTFSNTQSSIEILAFMTMKEVAAHLAVQTGHAVTPGAYPNRIVCYVQLRGPFFMVGESLPGGNIPTAARGFEVFDAQTGQLFEWGTLA